MRDLIISDNEINKDGIKMTWNQFLDAASSEKGLDIEGELYIDSSSVKEDIHQMITESIPTVKYFSMGNPIPSFLTGINIIDWSDKNVILTNQKQSNKEVFGRKKQTAMSNAENVDDRISGENDEEIVNNIQDTDFDPNIKYGHMDKKEVDHTYEFDDAMYDTKQARIILFGSSKGGTGKTFTSLISAYRYAKMNPDKRVAMSDFDIIDGQVGISVHKITPTMLDYYKNYKFGKDDFETMSRFKSKSENFPSNLDFYLAPRDIYIDDDGFWDSIFVNLIENYDTIFFDSGIDYMNYKPISTLYKIADKIILVSTTSIKSVSSVSKQIKRLKGEIVNPVFSKDDNIGDKLNLVITQAGKTDGMNSKVFATFQSRINIIGVFGVITPRIQKAEYYGNWSIFDDDTKFNDVIDRIVE